MSERMFVVGDLHVRWEEPWATVVDNRFLPFLLEQVERGDTVLFLGDTFHRARPYPEEIEIVFHIIESLKGKGADTILLNGNHEYSRDIFATSILKNRAIVISRPMVMSFGESKLAFLPWSPHRSAYSEYTMIEEEDVHIPVEDIDYLFYHFQDESISFGGESGVDLSKFRNATRMGGDIHIASKNYVGTPYPTRYDERGQIGRYFILNPDRTHSEHSFPQWIDYVSVPFGERVIAPFGEDEDGPEFPIIDIENAPSTLEAQKMYRDYSIHRISLQEGEDRDVSGSGLSSDEDMSDSSIKKFFEEYITINNVTGGIASYLQKKLFEGRATA
jgi:hypothetical protein